MLFRSVVDALAAPADPTGYLAAFGISIVNDSPGTSIVIIDDRFSYGGQALVASSPHNMLTQINMNAAIQFELVFSAPVTNVSFVRPTLLAGPNGILFPQWSATLFLDATPVSGPVGEGLGSYFTNQPAATFNLPGAGNRLVFSSNGFGIAAFSAVVIDDLNFLTLPPP